MRFENRQEAGRMLADKLGVRYKGQSVVVLALPRGGVVLGREVADALNAPLDLVIPRKIGHPMNPEYAVAAVTESGEPVCNEYETTNVDPRWLKEAIAKAITEAQRRRKTYLQGRTPTLLKGKTAIIIDDGVATGLTIRAAIKDVKKQQAAKVVVAIPVVPANTALTLQTEAGELVALDIDKHYLGAVGAYYDDFRQVTDEEVIKLLS